MKVIVVEDNPVYNDYICNLLKKGGFDTAHIAAEIPGENTSNEWCEPVTDEEYNRLFRS